MNYIPLILFLVLLPLLIYLRRGQKKWPSEKINLYKLKRGVVSVLLNAPNSSFSIDGMWFEHKSDFRFDVFKYVYKEIHRLIHNIILILANLQKCFSGDINSQNGFVIQLYKSPCLFEKKMHIAYCGSFFLLMICSFFLLMICFLPRPKTLFLERYYFHRRVSVCVCVCLSLD